MSGRSPSSAPSNTFWHGVNEVGLVRVDGETGKTLDPFLSIYPKQPKARSCQEFARVMNSRPSEIKGRGEKR